MVSQIKKEQGVLMIKTLDETLKYITELESENKVLHEELEHYRSNNHVGRKKHDEALQEELDESTVAKFATVQKEDARTNIMKFNVNSVLHKPVKKHISVGFHVKQCVSY